MKILYNTEKLGTIENTDINIDWNNLLSNYEKKYSLTFFLIAFLRLILLLAILMLLSTIFLDFLIGYSPIVLENDFHINIFTVISAFTIIITWYSLKKIRHSSKKIGNVKLKNLSLDQYLDLDANDIIFKTYNAPAGEEIDTLIAELNNHSLENYLSYTAIKKIQNYKPSNINRNLSRDEWLKSFLLQSYETAKKFKLKEINVRTLALNLLINEIR